MKHSCTGTFGEVRFDLKHDGVFFRWHFPDGSPTRLFRNTEIGAQRALAFNAPALAREYLKHRI
jgi:hypothetical protein